MTLKRVKNGSKRRFWTMFAKTKLPEIPKDDFFVTTQKVLENMKLEHFVCLVKSPLLPYWIV
jgi:hypothetical protein